MASFGDTLKRERELREITLREISDATKINVRYLEALEENRFDSLPGGLFNKGFIRAYSTYIGVDGEAMVNCYLQEIAARSERPGALTGAADQGVHRPAENPRRRATPRGEEGGGNGHPLAITLAESSPHASARASHTPSPPPPVAAEASAPRPSPVTGIEETTPGSGTSRVLSGILVLVGVAAALFIVLGLLLKHPESRARLPSPAPPGHGAAQEAPAAAGGPSTLVVAGTGSIVPEPPVARGAATAGHAPEAPAGDNPPAPGPASVADSPGSGIPLSGDAPAGAGPMHLKVEATGRTWVQLYCDAREEINWVMRAGDVESFQCLSQIQVNAADAGAVRLTIDGARCSPLGDAGSRAYGYTIRADDFRKICPAQGR